MAVTAVAFVGVTLAVGGTVSFSLSAAASFPGFGSRLRLVLRTALPATAAAFGRVFVGHVHGDFVERVVFIDRMEILDDGTLVMHGPTTGLQKGKE